MIFDLAFIWAGLIAFAVLTYVILDGFDLGIGILYPFARSEKDRDLMMNSVAPVWDGNETWLVLGGGGLFAVFPLAYATIMPALYAPIIAMLAAILCTPLVGMIPAMALFVLGWLKLVEGEPWLRSALVAATAALLTTLIFDVWLRVQFPPSLLDKFL